MIEPDIRYLQLAFNDDIGMVTKLLPTIQPSPRVMIEAGTPFIKREGMSGLKTIRRLWKGPIVADIKVVDGAADEVAMVAAAGATAVTVLGSAPVESLNLFVAECKQRNLDSMIDMLGVADPLAVLRHLHNPPAVVVLHLGRDEETTRGKVIEYRHIKRIRSKYDVSVSAAGGVDLQEARSAIFNGANIVVANIVPPNSSWQGIPSNANVSAMALEFLRTIE